MGETIGDMDIEIEQKQKKTNHFQKTSMGIADDQVVEEKNK